MACRARPLLALLALTALGCAGHAARTVEARSALDYGAPRQALAMLNEELEVDKAEELPQNVGGNNALLLLDRAMVLQALGSMSGAASPKEYTLSSRDLEVADKQVEMLDLGRDAAHDIAKYMFSDDVGPYKAPPYEKLMINTMNMVNYLVRGDLNGARVEARRLAVMQRYLKEHETPDAALSAPSSYLAGFIFEKSGEAQEALRYYDEALQHVALESLEEPIRRLARTATYRTPRINRILARNADPEPREAEPEPAEILVVINFGRVPAKRAKRVPIGLALTYASGFISPTDRTRANYLAAQGLVTWVNYPELGRPRGEYDTPGFALDGRWQRLEGALAVDRAARAVWEEQKGALVAAAITRMLSRVVAGEVVRRGSGGGIMGALLSLGTQATLTAADTPDTRSWSTLPARIAIGRVRVPPGAHWVDVLARGIQKRRSVVVRPGAWTVVNLTVLH